MSEVLVENPLGQLRVLAGRFNRKINILPPAIQKELSTEDVYTLMGRMERWWDPRNWPRRAKPHYLRVRLFFWSLVYGERNIRYETEYRTRTHVLALPSNLDSWPVDVSGFVRCASSPMHQYACTTEQAGDVVLDVGFDLTVVDNAHGGGSWGSLRGWVLVRAKTLRRLADLDTDERNSELRRRFVREYCRRKPRRPFVVVL
jgi:hypothetical protein